MRAIEKAATTIQASFRGYRVRKQLRSASKKNGPRRSMGATTNTTSNSNNSNNNNSRRRTSRSAIQPSHQPTITKSDNSGNEQQIGDKEMAAIKIQAGIRGFLVRKRKQAEHRAASKIQAGFRAFRERRKAKKRQIRHGK